MPHVNEFRRIAAQGSWCACPFVFCFARGLGLWVVRARWSWHPAPHLWAMLATTSHLSFWVLSSHRCAGPLWQLADWDPCAPPFLVLTCFHGRARRVEDFWRGYKLFCFAYYSHSAHHVVEFRHSKLGASLSFLPCCSGILTANCTFD